MPITRRPAVTARLENLLSQKTINDEKNDYRAYGRTLPGHTPPLFGQQYRFGKAETTKLIRRLTTNYDGPTRKKLLTELHARAQSGNGLSKGSVALTRDAAALLTKLAKSLHLELKFTSGQAKPMHPVG